MPDNQKSELGALRAQYKELVGKNPSPKLDVEGLKAKIAEIQASGSDDPKTATKEPAPAAPKGSKAKKAAEPTPSPLGTAYVKHPEGIGCSYGGVELAPDKQGRVLVPLQAVEELKAHGFEVA